MGVSSVVAGQAPDSDRPAPVPARVSQKMMTRWKSSLLTPVKPIFAKEGYGTVVDFMASGGGVARR